jgi:hypothetical protein
MGCLPIDVFRSLRKCLLQFVFAACECREQSLRAATYRKVGQCYGVRIRSFRLAAPSGWSTALPLSIRLNNRVATSRTSEGRVESCHFPVQIRKPQMKLCGFAIVILSFVGVASAQFESPDLKAGRVHLRHLVLAPVRTSVSQLDWKSGPYDLGKPMEAETRQAQKELMPVVTTALNDLGVFIDDKTLSLDTLTRNKELDGAFNKVEQQFNSNLQFSIWSGTVKPIKTPVAVGDVGSGLHLSSASDAIVFVRVDAWVETKGKKVSNAFSKTSHSVGGWTVRVGIVDARTGVIVFLASESGGDDIVKEPEKAEKEIGKGIEKSVRKFVNENKPST